MELREKLVMLRRQQGLTQNELAAKVGVTRQAVSKWERGVIAPSTVNLIALGRLYGVPLDELANGGMPPAEEPPAAVAVEERPEPAQPRRKPSPLRIAGAAALAACLLLTTIASAITVWSAVFNEPEKMKDSLTGERTIIANMEDVEGEVVDISNANSLIQESYNSDN